MGYGDEIMALGRAEELFKATGKQVAICNDIGQPRTHEIWLGNPAWNPKSNVKITDGAGCRPYAKAWVHRRVIWNYDYRPKAGKIYLQEHEKTDVPSGDFCIISPHVKDNASKNKDWGWERWEEVIKSFPMPVYQMVYDGGKPLINGAKPIKTKGFRSGAYVVSKARLVLTNEGGLHHTAASFNRPAVVVFGSFIPPSITGYDIHENIYRETEHGYCGNFDFCPECSKVLSSIKPSEIKDRVEKILSTELKNE